MNGSTHHSTLNWGCILRWSWTSHQWLVVMALPWQQCAADKHSVQTVSLCRLMLSKPEVNYHPEQTAQTAAPRMHQVINGGQGGTAFRKLMDGSSFRLKPSWTTRGDVEEENEEEERHWMTQHGGGQNGQPTWSTTITERSGQNPPSSPSPSLSSSLSSSPSSSSSSSSSLCQTSCFHPLTILLPLV